MVSSSVFVSSQFFILLLAYQTYPFIKANALLKKYLLFFCLFTSLTIVINELEYPHLNNYKLIITLLILFFCCLCLRYSSTYLPAQILLAALVVVDLSVNAFLCLRVFDYNKYGKYESFIASCKPAVDMVKKNDTSFYRLEKDFSYNYNDAMLLGYSGLSHYSSTEKAFVKSFMPLMGFYNNGNWARYQLGSTITADSLLGVKYLLSREDNKYNEYQKLSGHSNIYIYENPYCLPLGYFTNKQILQVDLTEKNLFELQNDIVASALGNPEINVLLQNLTPEPRLTNLSSVPSSEGCLYRKTDESASLTYSLTVIHDGPLYAYFPAPDKKPAQMYVNGKNLGTYFSVSLYGIVPLGDYKKGDLVELSLSPAGEELFFSDALFYTEDITAVDTAFRILESGAYYPDRIASSHLEGNAYATSERPFLLLTLPQEPGWNIKVDGKQIVSQTALSAFMLIELQPGAHNIELVYTPPGFVPGLCITTAGIAVLGFLFYKKYCVSYRKTNI